MRGDMKPKHKWQGDLALKDRSASDARLVKHARAGSQDAFAQLYQKYLPLLFYFIRKRTLSDQDAADFVQDAFVSALVKLDELKDPAAFRPWLFRIALSKVTDAQRKAARRTQDVEFDNPDFDEGIVLEPLTVSASSGQSPEEAYEEAESRSELMHYIDQLTPAQKDALILRYFIGFSTAMVADLLGLSQGAVNKRLYDASAALRALMRRGSEAQIATADAGEGEDSGALIERLLQEDSQACKTAGSDAEHLVTPKVKNALAALVVGGGLNASALGRTQAFLTSLNKGLSGLPAPAPKTTSSSAQTSSLQTTLGRIAVIGSAMALVYALGSGAVALWQASRRPAPAVTHAATRRPDSKVTVSEEASPTTEPAVSQDATAAVAQQTQEPAITPTVTNDPAVTSDPRPAAAKHPAPAPASALQPAPTISVAQPTLSYPLGTALTPSLVLADCGAVAQDFAGTRLPVAVAGVSGIDVNRAGTWLVFLNAQDARGLKAPSKVLAVVLE